MSKISVIILGNTLKLKNKMQLDEKKLSSDKI